MSTSTIPQFPSGHIGALTPDQQTKFDQFKQLCQSRNLYSPSSPEKGGLPSHDDPLLLRFLRARKWDQEGAYKQLEDTDKWRKECDLDGVYRWIDRGEYEETRRLYPQWIGRRDKRGMPVYVFEVAHLSSKAVTAYEQSTKLKNAPASHTSSTPAKLLRLFALYENLTNFALPLCTAATDRPNPEVPITQSNNIVDISGVGLKQFWELKAHLQDASTLATAHYPETLDRIFIIGAPSFFPTIWSWVKRWFDPIVVSKMFILSPSEVYPTLAKFMDPADIPIKYGGKLQFEFGDMPNIGGGLEGLVKWTGAGSGGGVPQGPILWRKGEKGRMDMVNQGSANGEKKEEVVGYIERDWEGVLYPGSSGVSGKGEGGSDKTVMESQEGGEGEGVEKAEVDKVPAAPTAPGPPVVA